MRLMSAAFMSMRSGRYVGRNVKTNSKSLRKFHIFCHELQVWGICFSVEIWYNNEDKNGIVLPHIKRRR